MVSQGVNVRLYPTFSLLLAIPMLAGPQVRSTPLAMVTDAQGDVRLGLEPNQVAITSEVAAGVPMKLKACAKATLLLYGTGEEVRLSGPGTFTFNEKGVASGPASGIRRSKGPGLTLKESLKPGGLAQASLVMRVPFDIDLVEPSQPTVRTARPQFRWVLVKGAQTYEFKLHHADGSVLFAATTQEANLSLPMGVRLQPGVKYHWVLSTDLPGARMLRSEGDLEVLDAERSRAINRLRMAAHKTFSDRLIYASALQVCGLLTEAKVEWRALAAQRPDDSSLRAFAR